MVSGLGDGVDPFVVGGFQIVLDFLSAHLYYIQLVLKGIDGEKVVEYQHPGADPAIVGEGSGDGDFCGLLAQAQGVEEVHVVAHAREGIAGVDVGVQDANFLQGEGFHRLKLFPEMGAHDRIGLFGLDGNQVCLEAFLRYLALFHLQVHFPVGDVAAVAAGVQEGAGVAGFYIGSVVVAADDPVHAFHAVEYVQGLGLQDGAVSLPAGGVHGCNHHVRAFLFPHIVHIFLDLADDGLEVHAAPDFFGEPGFDVGVVVADDGYLQPGLFHHFIEREVRLAVVVADGVAGHERGAGLDQVFLHAVVNRMPGLDVVVAHGDGVVLHVGHQPGEQVRGQGVYVIIVVGGVVSLQAVAGVHQKDILRPVRRAHAVYVVVHGKKGVPGAPSHISGVEPGAVHIVGGQHGKGIVPVPETAAAGGQGSQGGKECDVAEFHIYYEIIIQI